MAKEKPIWEKDRIKHNKEVKDLKKELENIINETSNYPAGTKQIAGELLTELKAYKDSIKSKDIVGENDYNKYNSIYVKVINMYKPIEYKEGFAQIKEQKAIPPEQPGQNYNQSNETGSDNAVLQDAEEMPGAEQGDLKSKIINQEKKVFDEYDNNGLGPTEEVEVSNNKIKVNFLKYTNKPKKEQ